MRKTLQHPSNVPSTLLWPTLALGLALMGPLLTGCGETAPRLEPKVTSPVGRSGVCAFCNKKIDNVTKTHLITVDAVEYIVCDKKCGAGLKKWVAEQ